VIEQRAVAVGRGTELCQIFREELGVVPVDLRHVRDELGDVVVMRERVVRFGNANLRIRPRALLLANHERDDAREIRLERQNLQVEHQREVVFEDRRRPLRRLQGRELDVPLLLGLRDAPLDVANRLGVFLDLRLILWSEILPEARQLLVHRVQNALVLP
jgi:hypothetical protein